MSTIVSSLCVLFLVILSTPIESRIGTHCGRVKLKSEKVVKHGTVEIEYIPSIYVTNNIKPYWVRSDNTSAKALTFGKGTYEQTQEQNNKNVLTIYMFSASMNGGYGVYCDERLQYTNIISVELPEPPSVPVINGIQNIEHCTGCIVGEDNDRIALACEIHGGSHPLNVTITIGNESFPAQKYLSTTYKVFYTVRDQHHMENVIFSVMNGALSTPLSVTAQMFVIKPPTFHFLVPEILRDGEAVTCTVEGGRPNPNVYVSISGSNVSSAHHFYNRTTSLNTNIITLTTFKKEWNKENITCCRYNKWYKMMQKCSQQQQVNYLFPPSGVMLEVKTVVDSPSQMYANCTVYGSNPACNAQIKAPSGIIGSKRSSTNISQPHGAWNSVSEVNLNVSEEDNGKDVTCVVDCDEFSVDLTDTVKILLPHKVDEEDKYNNKQRTTGQASDKSIIWIILGAGVLLVVIIVIAVVFVVFRKKGQTLEDKREGRVHHQTQEGHTRLGCCTRYNYLMRVYCNVS
ncbi:uncharacterized protein LOC132714427 isoform X2 [Ruditapes philippinarum]|uniref:uncharacterized protein LOC132714427 isoform X2 n=1 Tax=Ruditapes philippinarum TaxID=129788 RepID=UPI00295B744E|nr:uncharacterized protein LOC132714427 isoform X2 [Ruditapes philippinarum]